MPGSTPLFSVHSSLTMTTTETRRGALEAFLVLIVSRAGTIESQPCFQSSLLLVVTDQNMLTLLWQQSLLQHGLMVMKNTADRVLFDAEISEICDLRKSVVKSEI